jgi:hypothetical protein
MRPTCQKCRRVHPSRPPTADRTADRQRRQNRRQGADRAPAGSCHRPGSRRRGLPLPRERRALPRLAVRASGTALPARQSGLGGTRNGDLPGGFIVTRTRWLACRRGTQRPPVTHSGVVADDAAVLDELIPAPGNVRATLPQTNPPARHSRALPPMPPRTLTLVTRQRQLARVQERCRTRADGVEIRPMHGSGIWRTDRQTDRRLVHFVRTRGSARCITRPRRTGRRSRFGLRGPSRSQTSTGARR